MSEFETYIGKPYERGAQGPAAYDCAGLLRAVQRDHFGIEIPMVFVHDYDDGLAVVSLIDGEAKEQGWSVVETPAHGDMVVIRKPYHVGVWLDIDGGGVLHAINGGSVVWTPDASWRVSGFGRRKFMRHRSRM